MIIPEPVLGILRRLEDAGYETWCVGGAIRDALLNDPQQDVDLATAAPPDVVRKLFRRTVPVGIEHGTVGVLDDGGVLHEVTTFRRDVRTDGRHAVVEFGVSLDDDLARRDFTVNAIAYHPVRDEWRDPFGGRDDLARRVLRAVGDPAARFREDRLRILRGLRFASRFAFAIDPATWEAAKAQAPDTGHLSAERIRGEWIKGIATAKSVLEFVRLWRESGVATVWLPELDAANIDALHEAALDPRDPLLVSAVVCSAAAGVWQRFKGSAAEIRRAEAIDRGPPAPGSAAPRDVRRWMATTGDAIDDLRTLARWRSGPADWMLVVDNVRAKNQPTSRGELAIDGQDLVAAGIPAEPGLGRLLQRLLDAVIDDPTLNMRESLLALAREGAADASR